MESPRKIICNLPICNLYEQHMKIKSFGIAFFEKQNKTKPICPDEPFFFVVGYMKKSFY